MIHFVKKCKNGYLYGLVPFTIVTTICGVMSGIVISIGDKNAGYVMGNIIGCTSAGFVAGILWPITFPLSFFHIGKVDNTIWINIKECDISF